MALLYRDIMDALANIEDIVRAAQFIGQSSGLKFYYQLSFVGLIVSKKLWS